MRRFVLILSLALSTTVLRAVPQDQPKQPGIPGTVNYVESEASSSGSTRIGVGASFATQESMAELLLTPGAFLRVGRHASVKAASLDPARNEMMVEQGKATVEAVAIGPTRRLRINVSGAAIQIVENGLYEFDAKRQQVHVFAGEARVRAYGRDIDLVSGQWLDLSTVDALAPAEFDESSYAAEELYVFTCQRSAYLAEANADAATALAQAKAGGANDNGWYWNASYDTYTYLPASATYHTTFGWAFYPPRQVHLSPIYVRHSDKWTPARHRYDRDPDRWGPGKHYRAAPLLRPTTPLAKP